jgi:hypothetical protein
VGVWTIAVIALAVLMVLVSDKGALVGGWLFAMFVGTIGLYLAYASVIGRIPRERARWLLGLLAMGTVILLVALRNIVR